MEEYTKIENIGEDTYEVTYKGRHKTTDQVVAMKKIRLESKEEGFLNSVIQMCLCRIPGYISSLDSLDLEKYLDSTLLVSSWILHLLRLFVPNPTRDCKSPSQRLRTSKSIDNKGTKKPADFGFARDFGIPIRVHTHEVAMLWYRSPKVLLRSTHYSTPVDIWSLDTIFAELATKKPLFHGDSEVDQLFRIFRALGTLNNEV
ncbi:hypothetical protein HPG69_013285 [Diceros bicornis minor]|uniref:Protein kinase domain-containing protein n=1 Tax=Diceros bicornis minor TaxID=77932 RepID=A0A7J7F4I6_DICBM|nr:hypothetical protein HPG69_013285 [Diceros bicornis minor]